MQVPADLIGRKALLINALQQQHRTAFPTGITDFCANVALDAQPGSRSGPYNNRSYPFGVNRRKRLILWPLVLD
jgi:hypothetical protein